MNLIIKIAVLVLFSLYLSDSVGAQEISMEVQVNAPALQIADESVIRELENEIKEFFNFNSFTSDDYLPHERIDCNLHLNITEELSSTRFRATLIITSSRPVYMSDYSTQVLNIVDDQVTFEYDQTYKLRENSLSFTDNLSSILTFYAFMIIGFDSDTFSYRGGELYFNNALTIINNLPVNMRDDGGWRRGEQRNRFEMVNNVINPRLDNYRQAIYDYHRKGLDIMYNNAALGKENMLKALKLIDRDNRRFRNTYTLYTFFNSKKDEVIEVFRNSPKNEQRGVYNIMSTLVPSQSAEVSVLK